MSSLSSVSLLCIFLISSLCCGFHTSLIYSHARFALDYQDRSLIPSLVIHYPRPLHPLYLLLSRNTLVYCILLSLPPMSHPAISKDYSCVVPVNLGYVQLSFIFSILSFKPFQDGLSRLNPSPSRVKVAPPARATGRSFAGSTVCPSSQRTALRTWISLISPKTKVVVISYV